MNVIPMCPKLKIPHSQAATWSSCPESMNFFSRNRSAPGEVWSLPQNWSRNLSLPFTPIYTLTPSRSLSPVPVHTSSDVHALSRSFCFIWAEKLAHPSSSSYSSFFFLWVFSLFLLFQNVLSHFYLVDGDERKMVWTSGEPVSALRSMLFDFFGAVVLRLPASRCDRYFNRSLILSVLAV